MRAGLHNVALIEHQNGVRLLDRGQPVGDNDGSPALGDLLRSLLDQLLRISVNGRGGLVEDQDAGVAHIGPQEGDQLALPAGEHGAPFLYVVLIPPGEAADKVVHPDLPGCLFYSFHGNPRVLQGNVVCNGIGKKEDILQHYGYVIPQGGEGILPDVLAVEQDGPRLDVVKPVQQVDDGRLPGPGGTDNGDLLPGFHGKGYAVEHFFIRLVAKTYVPERNGPLHMAYLQGTCIFDAAFGIQDLENPACRYHPHLQGVEFVGQLPQGAEEHLDQQDEGKKGPGNIGPNVHDILQPAIPDHQADGQGGDDLRNGKEKRVVPDGLQPGILVLFIDLPELFSLDFLPGKELYDLHPGKALLHKGVQVGYLGPHLGKGHLHGPLEDPGGVKDKGQDGKDQKGQLPVHPDHDGRSGKHLEQVGHNHEKALGKDLPDALQVGNGPGNQHPQGRTAEIGHAESHHLVEQGDPHVLDHRFPQPVGVIGKQELAHHLAHQHGHHPGREFKKQVPVALWDGLVDDLLEDHGGEHRENREQNGCQGGAVKGAPVGFCKCHHPFEQVQVKCLAAIFLHLSGKCLQGMLFPSNIALLQGPIPRPGNGRGC